MCSQLCGCRKMSLYPTASFQLWALSCQTLGQNSLPATVHCFPTSDSRSKRLVFQKTFSSFMKWKSFNLAWSSLFLNIIKQPQSFSSWVATPTLAWRPSCTLELFKENSLSLSLDWLCYHFNDHFPQEFSPLFPWKN